MGGLGWAAGWGGNATVDREKWSKLEFGRGIGCRSGCRPELTVELHLMNNRCAAAAVVRIAGFDDRKRLVILEGPDGAPHRLAALRQFGQRGGRCRNAAHPTVPDPKAPSHLDRFSRQCRAIPTSSESTTSPMHRPSRTGATCCGSLPDIAAYDAVYKRRRMPFECRCRLCRFAFMPSILCY